MDYEAIKTKYADKAKEKKSVEVSAKERMNAAEARLKEAEEALYQAAQLRNKSINHENSGAYWEALHERNRMEKEFKEAKREYDRTRVGDLTELCSGMR